jgi:prevent-host-death family protein
MSDFSIAEAKAQFAQLVNEAEAGQAVRITRRGVPVAVVLSDQEYQRLQAPKGGWVAFSHAWRQTMADEGLALMSDAELDHLRDRSERPPVDL